MKFLFLVVFQLLMNQMTLADVINSPMKCSLEDNRFTIIFDDQVWTKDVSMYPWSYKKLVCGTYAAAAIVDNNFLSFSIIKGEILMVKILTLDFENIQLDVGNYTVALIAGNYLRIENIDSTFEQYFDTFSQDTLLSVHQDMTAVIYDSNLMVMDRGVIYNQKIHQNSSVNDKILKAKYGFAIQRGTNFLVYDKFRTSFNSKTMTSDGNLITYRNTPIFTQPRGMSYFYDVKSGTFILGSNFIPRF